MSTQETAKTLYLEANGTNYTYRIIGNRSDDSSPPLLMLNHVRSTIDTWDPFVINNLTATGRQVITYDYAGLGHSNGTIAPSIRAFALNLLAFLSVLLPTMHTPHVDVLGFSMGGYIAQQLALDSPDVVRKLVLAGTGPSLGPDLERPMTEVQSTVFNPTPGIPTIEAFFPSFTTGDEGAAWFNRSTTSRTDMAGQNGEPDIALFTTGDDLVNLTQAYLTWDADPVPYALLQTIQKDALVTNGDNDLIVPTKNSYVLARQLPRANFVMFPSSGHGHLFQYARYYTKLVGEFLDGMLPTAPFSSGNAPAFGTYGRYNQ
ncbi:alpha/beta-hydrolase [Aspergillus sclerotioniger CBS 115572]|uniref:Alpha/beta-hydrolase n=1 Tax=Aspergillus sclerotioniger CBS 115572 TaxID=1450535 RepID=A0A317X720_9EURO|nr:alpha/beta-hydrolase [Aspergillus sclerotioniger CBS 115572]PWY94135.1 alpha/beta-hydrolase [Aspergillus sclerotioniger CBS 115572]